MKRIFFLVTINLSVFTGTISAQSPELVIDYNNGEESSFSLRHSAKAEGNIILSVDALDIGTEPAVIRNGVFSILKDLIEGEEGSNPTNFYAYDGKVYFSAKDTQDSYALWETNGTEIGTKIALKVDDATFRAGGFTEGNDGALYYTYAGNAYRLFEGQHTLVMEGAAFSFIFSDASYNYSKYKEGVAYLKKLPSYAFELYYINESGNELLATTDEASFFSNGFGLGQIENGLMFTISDDEDVQGIYAYLEDDQKLERFSIGSSDLIARRTIDASADENLVWIGGEGYYLINSYPNGYDLVYERTNNVGAQGEIFEFAQYQDKTSFVVTDHGIFGPFYVLYYDKQSGEITNLGEIESYHSNMKTFGKYAVMADGTSNLFTPAIQLIDMEEGMMSVAYTFSENSTNTNSVNPIGVQDGYLYYFYNLDESIGRELYRIKIDELVTTTEEGTIFNKNYRIDQNGNDFIVSTDERLDLDISLISSNGQLVYHNQIESDSQFTIDVISGIYFMTIESDIGTITTKVWMH